MPLVLVDLESYTDVLNLDMRVLHDISCTLTSLPSTAGNHASLRLTFTTTLTRS